MKKYSAILIASVLVLIILGTVFSFYRLEEVPDVDWNAPDNFESKEPNGSFVFHELVKEYFEDQKLYYNTKDTVFSNIDTSGALYMRIGGSFSYYNEKVLDLVQFIEKGNTAFLIGNVGISSDSFDYLPKSRYGTYDRDSILNFRFNDDSEIEFQYSHYSKNFTNKALLEYRKLNRLGDERTEVLGFCNDAQIFSRTKVGNGELYMFSVPQYFSNLAATQEGYKEFVNYIFDHIECNTIILDHPSFDRFSKEMSEIESPLEYVLSDKYLSKAYYFLLLSCFLYLLFQTKRRQKAIPVLSRNRNTSVEYIETLSKLFASQNEPTLLIPHIRNYFYHTVKSKYYLEERDPEFLDNLAKKSKVDKDELAVLLKMLSRDGSSYNFPDDQLVNLHYRVENFYKKAK